MSKGFILGLLACAMAWSQQAPPADAMREVLERIAKLEEQNRALTNEVRELRERLGPVGTAADTAPLAERVEVTEHRVAELDQTRVTTDNKLPVSLTGMLLFNAYLNGQASAGGAYPTLLPATGRAAGAGATFRQSVIGMRYDGPTVLGGAKVKGALFMDFFGGGTGLNQTMRLRVASIDVAWKNTTVGFAFDKPIVAPREPDSLAQVGVSPLTAAGNLWLWQPQVRLEHRRSWKEHAGVRAQVGLYQTAEERTGVAAIYSDSLAASRPGYEGRVELWAQRGSRRIEIAPGFHLSSTRVVGRSLPSRIFTLDWLIRPAARVDLTGAFFSGENTSVIGGIRQGVSIFFTSGAGLRATPVHSIGGWAQLKLRATQRMTFHVFAGQQDDRNRDLLREGVAKNQALGANVMYRWGSNMLVSFEASQVRTTYFSSTRINPHYDLAIAYLF
ncbi:MAG: hypothetical protein ABIR70_02055 [Bryobacteraceae bacterium]